MIMRRRGALMRGAMVGGAAYYAGRKVAQGEQREYDQQQRIEALESQQAYQAPPPQQQYYSPPPQQQHYSPPVEQKSVVEELTELKGLLDAGVLTQAEFDAQKARILQGK